MHLLKSHEPVEILAEDTWTFCHTPKAIALELFVVGEPGWNFEVWWRAGGVVVVVVQNCGRDTCMSN